MAQVLSDEMIGFFLITILVGTLALFALKIALFFYYKGIDFVIGTGRTLRIWAMLLIGLILTGAIIIWNQAIANALPVPDERTQELAFSIFLIGVAGFIAIFAIFYHRYREEFHTASSFSKRQWQRLRSRHTTSRSTGTAERSPDLMIAAVIFLGMICAFFFLALAGVF